MPTELLYMVDSYLKEFEASIIGISDDGLSVYLDRTAFFPGGGGQPHDIGKLVVNNEEYSVVKIGRDQNREYYHKFTWKLEGKVVTYHWDKCHIQQLWWDKGKPNPSLQGIEACHQFLFL